jgi:hypothetical protein
MIFGSLFARKKDEEEKKKYEKQNPQKIFFTKNISEEEKINKKNKIINKYKYARKSRT